MKSIVSIALWKAITLYERYFLMKDGLGLVKKLLCDFECYTQLIENELEVKIKINFLMICFKFCTKSCEILAHTYESSTKTLLCFV